MSFRDFVSGSDVCAPSDGAGPSNAMGQLVNTLLGSSSKTQEQLRELPVGQQYGLHPSHQVPMTPEAAAMAAAAGPSLHHGGLPAPGPVPTHAVDAFLHARPAPGPASLEELEHIFSQGQPGPGPGHVAALPAGAALAHHFRSFMDTARNRAHFAPVPLPGVSLSLQEQCRIRDRSTIMARHLFAEQGEGFADQQVSHLLASLNINPAQLPHELAHVHNPRWHGGWHGPQEGPVAADVAAAQRDGWDALWRQPPPMQQQQQQQPGLRHTPSTGWAAEFEQQHMQQPGPPPAWVQEFEPLAQSTPEAWAAELAEAQAQAQPSHWAAEFSEQQQQQQASGQGSSAADMASAVQHSRKMLDVLSNDPNPKMRSSKFLQFLSKMSNGELLFEDNKVVERPSAEVGGAWASEFGEAHAGSASASAWASQFQQQQQQQQQQAGNAPADWADEFARGVADLKLSDAEELEASWAEASDEWARQFSEQQQQQQPDEEQLREWEQLYGAHVPGPGGSLSKHEYVFAQDNPFLGDPDALAKGKALFKAGVLSEAALALEAEVQARPGNADAWRLLGTVHAENDDDIRAIAAMGRALGADPANLDVLLALGVSHTNELDAGEAVHYLSQWLRNHPVHGEVAQRLGAAPDSSQALGHAVRLFEEAARLQRGSEAELHMALGVLHHLARQYNRAVGAFEAALALRPQDYSLWNKLGATMANHSRSADAIGAYQRALDLKPNYMRAWTNLGISYANLGEYEASARFYVRALGLNREAPQVWSYLRTSISCAGRSDLLEAIDGQQLEVLQQALPLE